MNKRDLIPSIHLGIDLVYAYSVKKDEITPHDNSISEAKPEADILDELELSGKEAIEVLKEASAGTALSSIPVLNKIFEWSERVNQAAREKKLKMLLAQYAQSFASIEEAQSKLAFVVGTTQGRILFHKVLQLSEKGTEDPEWIRLLANVLGNMSDSDIEAKFNEYEYALSQIDRLSVHAVIVLSKYEGWKKVSLSGSTTTSKHTVLGDWDSQAANFLARNLNVTESAIILRIGHSFLELERAGMVVLDGSQLKLDIIGAEVYRVINR